MPGRNDGPDIQELPICEHKQDVQERQKARNETASVETASNPLKFPSTSQSGITPKYLIEHHQAMQKEAEECKRCSPDLGFSARRCYPRRFREETNLCNAEEKLLRPGPGIEKSPIKTHLRIMYNRRMELTKKLNKTEEAINVLSKPKVFVKLDVNYKFGNIYTFKKPYRFMSDSFGVQHSAAS